METQQKDRAMFSVKEEIKGPSLRNHRSMRMKNGSNHQN